MRITNNMILHTSANNINSNKINVDALNNQMTTQKKIQRPSENPVIAIRSLRLRTTLSEIDQYYTNNIPDAESWLDVTSTALDNMKKILTDIRSQCVNGSNDPLKAEDRETILKQLQALRGQIYSEGNADYAGRTVFTGYRTNQKLTFMNNDAATSYEISQKFSFSDLKEHRFYSGELNVPTSTTEIAATGNITETKESVYDRIRLGYGGIGALDGETAGPPATADITYNYTDGTGAAQTDTLKTTIYDTYEDWAKARADGTYDIADDEAVFIRESGELVLSGTASSTLKSRRAEFEVNYTKTGFDKGEVRPEYYYNCTNVTDTANPVEYQKFDANGKEIYQNINYVVSANQTLTVNTNASDVFDSAIGRDVDELINAVQNAMSANQKLADIEAMLEMEQYKDPTNQEALKKWQAAAKKEADYADDNMQKLYDSYIGNCDKYLEKVNLAQTEVGSKGVSLELTKTRVSNQQTTMETLKSSNENREMSDIIIDYTAAYAAYEASLQAASKINQNTLLNYL